MLKFLSSIILFFIIFLANTTSCFAFENIISSLNVDNETEYEIEVVAQNNEIYLPLKVILDLFNISFSENHAQKSINFGEFKIVNSELYKNNDKLNYKVFYVKNGITDIKNEYFIVDKAFSQILGYKVTSDFINFVTYIKTKDEVAVENGELSKEKRFEGFLVKEEKQAKGYNDLYLPKKQKAITFDTLSVRQNMLSDTYSQIYQNNRDTNLNYNNNLNLTLNGKIKSGDYSLELGTNSYNDNLLGFSGITPQYRNKTENFEYTIGKPQSWEFDGLSMSHDILGVQIKDIDNKTSKKTDVKNLEGKVNKGSIIKVSINDGEFVKKIDTYNGYYTLKKLNYYNKIKNIKLSEMMQNGNVREILNIDYEKQKDEKKFESKKDIIAGISGYQNRIFAMNDYIYEANAKKLVLGTKYEKPLNDKITYESFLIADSILSENKDSRYLQSIFGNKNYLNFTNFRNPNNYQGITQMNILNINHNNKLDSKFYLGLSQNTTQVENLSSGLGYYLKWESCFNPNNKTQIKGSVFSSSKDFYVAGNMSNGGFYWDRLGGNVSLSTTIKKCMFQGSYSKYLTNFSDYFNGGKMQIDDYNLYFRTNFQKMPNLNIKLTNKQGSNGIGEIQTGMFEASLSKRYKNININSGIRQNNYKNIYKQADFINYTSKYQDIYTDISFPLGKKFGNATISNNIVKTKSNSVTNDYKQIKISYNTPMIKDISLNINAAYHYSGTNKGTDLGIGLTKRLKSGSTVSLAYHYSVVPFVMINNIYIPSNMRHSINLDFGEVYGFGDKSLEPIGLNNINKGKVVAKTFLDLNLNGIKDETEPYIGNIPIKFENHNEPIFTDKNGTTSLVPLEEGIYNVSICEDNLPTFLNVHKNTNPSRYVKVESGNLTPIEFGLISSSGQIEGTVTIKNEYGEYLKFNDLVVSIFDANNKEIDYTNLNNDGTFSFSSLAPGKYQVKIVDELLELLKIEPTQESKNFIVEIPCKYEDFVTVDNVNLEYVYKL